MDRLSTSVPPAPSISTPWTSTAITARRMAYLLQMCSNNLNQYAKAANENGRVYAADMEDLRQRLDELIDIGRQILSRLAEL